MILLVPVSRFAVSYEIGAGRPYSRLEELVCTMIAKAAQPVTLEDLRATFQVHDRLLIESVVTLVRAGWAAMNQGEGLVITEQGRQTVGKGGKPQATLIERRRVSLYMERVCGLLEREASSDLNVRSLRDLGDMGMSRSEIDEAAMPIRNRRNSLSVGQAQGHLPHRPGAWIRWIGEPTMQTKAGEFVPVHVNLSSRIVTGLPRSWEPLLNDILLSEAESRLEHDAEFSADESSGKADQLGITSAAGENFAARTSLATPIKLSPDGARLIRDAAEFQSVMSEAIDTAPTSLLIVTPLIDRISVRSWESKLKAAVSRGVRVDVLWGRTDEDDDGFAELKRISAQSASGSLRLLRFNNRPTDVISQFVIADRSDNNPGHGAVALVGGAPLLGRAWQDTDLLPALVLRDAAAVACLARAAAGWWAQTPGEEFSAATDRWRRLASEWEQHAKSIQVPSTEHDGTALILLDADCALLNHDDYLPGAVSDVVVRGYSSSQSDGSPALKGAVAVRLRREQRADLGAPEAKDYARVKAAP